MQKSNKTRWNKQIIHDCLLCAGAAFLIVVFFVSGVLNAPKVWPDVQMMHLQEDASYRLDQGDEYGVVAVGPYYNLDKGIYRLRWQINGDGANIIRFGHSTDGKITPEEVRTQPNEWQGEVYFEIEEPVHNFHLSIEFAEGSWMEIYNLRLYTPEYTDGAWAASCLLIVILVLCLMHRHRKLNAEHVEALWVLGLAVLIISIPALGQDALDSIDMAFHSARIMNLADGLAHGQFPARIGGFSYNGYGAVTSAYYPDLLLYPFAGMLLGGASLAFVINAIRIVTYAVMAWVMYISSKRMLGSHSMALCASILLIFSPFITRDMYRNFMIGQLQAIAVMPLMLLGLWEVIWGKKERWPILVLAATLIIQSHRLSTVLCALLACFLGAIYLPRILREKRMGSIVKAIVFTMLINLSSLVPFATLYLSGVNTKPMVFAKFTDMVLSLNEVLKPDQWIGLPLMIGIVCFWIRREAKGENRKRLELFCVIGIATAFLSTTLIPWGHIIILTREAVTILQFPWRLLMFGVPMLCICAGHGYVLAFGKKGLSTVMLTLGLAALTIWPSMDKMMQSQGWLEFGLTANRILVQEEYQIEGTDVNDIHEVSPILSGDIELKAYQKDSTEITAELVSAGGGAVEFPLFAFDGYKAELDGHEIAIARGDNNRIRVEVPAGASGQLRIWFEGKLLWRIADAVSLGAAAALCAYVIRKRKNEFAR